MQLRFTLTHAVLGTQVISAPEGWETSLCVLQRDKEFYSLIEGFEGDFVFYGSDGETDGGINFIKEVESTYGADAVIEFLIEISLDGAAYDTVFSGTLNLWDMEELTDNLMKVPVIPSDFWTRFKTRIETPVDLLSATNLDSDSAQIFESINLVMLGQKLNKRIYAENRDDQGLETAITNGQYLQVDFDYVQIEELEEKYTLPLLLNNERPVEYYIATERGLHTFDIRIYSYILGTALGIVFASVKTDGGSSSPEVDELDFYIQKNEETPIAFSWQDVVVGFYDPTDTITEFTYNGSIFLEVGDAIRIYGVKNGDIDGVGIAFVVWNSNRFELLAGGYTSYIDVVGVTEYPDTNCQSFLLHDVFALICDRITCQDSSFYSEVLGSAFTTARQYEEDGCYWPYAAAKGLQIRQYALAEKPFFESFIDAWKGANPILCLGLTYESVSSQNTQVVPNYSFLNNTSWDNVGSGYDWEIVGGTAKVIIPSVGSSKFFRAYLNSQAQTGTYNLEIVISSDNIGGGDSPRIAWYVYDVDGNVIYSSSISTAGVPINTTRTDSFLASAVPGYVEFQGTLLGGSDITFYISSYSLTGPVSGSIVRIEPRDYFFDPTVSINFSNVRSISRKYDTDLVFSGVEVGFDKWRSEDVSGIDDPQTKHTYATVLSRSGAKTAQIKSGYIAASYAIETTRRATKKKTADHKFDDETFIIAINPNPVVISPETSPDVADYYPELDDNFDSVTNLLNSDTRYNLRLTPARSLLRWLKWLSGTLQKYLTSAFMFTSGEGNYDTVTQMIGSDCDENYDNSPLAENADISPLSEYNVLPEVFQIEIPMTWDEYKMIRDNRTLAIGISQTSTGHVPFFIKSLEYSIVNSNATILAWPSAPFDIQVIPDEYTQAECTTQAEDCEGGITDDLGELITDDFGECITV